MDIHIKLLPNFAGKSDALAHAMPGDAGIDLYSAVDVILQPGERLAIPVGIAMAMPEGVEAQVRPRSGRALKGLGVANSPGTVDSSFRGEVKVIAQNLNSVVSVYFVDSLFDVLSGAGDLGELVEVFDRDVFDGTIHIQRGDRIAQMVFAQYLSPQFEFVKELPESERGSRGFGSTGA